MQVQPLTELFEATWLSCSFVDGNRFQVSSSKDYAVSILACVAALACWLRVNLRCLLFWLAVAVTVLLALSPDGRFEEVEYTRAV